MLTLDAHESQGFGLEEAMSSGVPLLVMDAASMYDEMDNGVNATYEHLRPNKLFATSVPYWSDECGIKITKQSELSDAIDKILITYDSFTPRDYIVRTLSDEVCMRRILDYFNLNYCDIKDLYNNTIIMSAEWDNFTYFTNDNEFLIHISKGTSEPYDGGYNSQLNIVKRYISKYPLRNRVMIDVGAHIGTTMLPYSRLFSKIYGFEPNKESFDFCLKNIEYNNIKNCSVENCAILNRKIVGIPVQHNTCNSGCFYFKEDNTGVPSKILDEDDRFIDVDFIKIDTEGAEYYVMLGALDIIKKYKPLIQAEMNGLCEKNFGIPSFVLIEFLTSLGYNNISGTDFFFHNDYTFN
jgi:FkbM family methyltransferase